MTKYCDGTTALTPCPHPEDCTISCEFNDAVVLRKVKPYPHVPPDFNQQDDATLERIGSRLMWAIRVAIFIWVFLMAASGIFFWSLFL